MTQTLGDGPIEQQYRDQMNSLARAIDQFFNGNGDGETKKTGFILMIFPFDNHDGRCNYISNAKRDDVKMLLKEQLSRFEGMPDMKGTA
jgi:hypothetical protein